VGSSLEARCSTAIRKLRRPVWRAGVLGHPAMAIAWLANKVGAFGTVLEPGHLMLSGSFTRPVWANPGDTLHADFGALGSVAVQFI
jgi:2-oxo-hept-3-ene-1,7-dioate hydratase